MADADYVLGICADCGKFVRSQELVAARLKSFGCVYCDDCAEVRRELRLRRKADANKR